MTMLTQPSARQRKSERLSFCRTAAALGALSFLGTAAGCLNRPIEPVEPRTTTTVREKLTQGNVDKIDLLLAIDSSGSMADKQQILAEAVPDLVQGLVNPRCLDNSGQVLAQPAGPLEKCPDGSRREFPPVLDVHVGIISSSLGGYGGFWCNENAPGGETSNDRAHLLARTSPLAAGSVPTYLDAGFLAWDPAQKLDPPGEKNIGDIQGQSGLIPTLKNMVEGVGQVGCGFEAQLESWYRFLVDPEPYLSIQIEGGVGKATEIDKVLLDQRASFLRPDSLLAILMLSDENDCSMNAETLAHWITSDKPLSRMRSECSTDPADRCCAPCNQAPAECAPDATCQIPMDVPDVTRLRCFDQKRRYGYDFLHPIDRYVTGLTAATVPDRAGNLVPNPIFSNLNPAAGSTEIRNRSLVFLGSIVGVPWQDIARDPTDLTKGFKNWQQMQQRDTQGRTGWDIVLGDPENGIAPADPFMQESVAPRSGTNPITGDSIQPPGPVHNAINGTERAADQDLQFACIFPLPQSRICAPGDSSCDCSDPDPNNPNPLCKPDGTGQSTNEQTHAKAYPSLRELNVLRDLGPQGIVASVCAAQSSDKSRQDYGYRPAIGALVDQLKDAIGIQCLPRSLEVSDEVETKGQVSCLVIQARNSKGGVCCDPAAARQPVSTTHAAALGWIVEDPISQHANWDCFCEIPQLAGDELTACQADTNRIPMLNGEEVNGWCYVDATTTPQTGNEELVARCADTEKRMIRFAGKGEVQPDATMFIMCSGE
jgi:hypothetical protein